MEWWTGRLARARLLGLAVVAVSSLVTPLPADRGYGYGWFVGGTGRARLVNHSGSVLGFWAYNGFYPARDIVVVVLGNLDTIAINPISAQLNRLAAGQLR